MSIRDGIINHDELDDDPPDPPVELGRLLADSHWSLEAYRRILITIN